MEAALSENASSDRKEATPARLSFAGMVLDLDGRSLADISGANLPLTPSEFDLLATFCATLVLPCHETDCCGRQPAASRMRSTAASMCWSGGCAERSSPIRKTHP
jgi:hypothetical protein